MTLHAFARGTAQNDIFCYDRTATSNRGKLPQYKLIQVQCTKKSTRAPVSPVTQAQKRRFFVSNGSVTPRKESFAKPTQVMLLGRWSPDNIASRLVDIGVKLEPWLRRYSRKTIKNVFSIQIGAEKSGNPGKGLKNRMRAPP